MTRTVAVIVFSGVQSLDVSGPMDVFAEANRFLPPEAGYRLEVIGVERGWVPCSNIQAHRHFSEAPGRYDLLLCAGGPSLPGLDFGAEFHAWLRSAVARAGLFGSICNGAFMLARAGLPTARVEADRLYVQDGELFTSAGVTAGIDLSLYLLSREQGSEIALSVARRLLVFTQRSGGQSQFSPYLTPHAEPGSLVAQVQVYVLTHLAADLSIAELAKVANMSARNFSRVFVRESGVTPAEFVESARVDAARVLLESGGAPLKAIAYECGFRDAHHMRSVFQRRLGVSAQQFRQNFAGLA